MSETRTEPAEVMQPLPVTTNIAKSRNLPLVLLVEDDALVREVTGDILEYEGYQVLRARNAQAAKIAFYRHGETVRLLITDVVLPGQNGGNLASELRTASPTLRTIFISGFPENVVTGQKRVEGETFYLAKPFSAESLVRTVKQALECGTEKKAI
jgi:two-component system cell cycle sensor histidine kinase/response regulator CckA